MNARKSTDRTCRPDRLGQTVSRAVRPLLKKRGFAEVDILNHWETIVGEDLARMTCPVRPALPRGRRDRGTLHIRAPGALAPEVQHRFPRLRQKINAYFGYQAVEKLRLIQGPLPAGKEDPAPRPLPPDPETRARLDALVEDVNDSQLGTALRNLGEALYQEKQTEKDDDI